MLVCKSFSPRYQIHGLFSSCFIADKWKKLPVHHFFPKIFKLLGGGPTLVFAVLQILLEGRGGACTSTLKQYQAKADYFACACLQKNDGYDAYLTPGKDFKMQK